MGNTVALYIRDGLLKMMSNCGTLSIGVQTITDLIEVTRIDFHHGILHLVGTSADGECKGLAVDVKGSAELMGYDYKQFIAPSVEYKIAVGLSLLSLKPVMINNSWFVSCTLPLIPEYKAVISLSDNPRVQVTNIEDLNILSEMVYIVKAQLENIRLECVNGGNSNEC